MKAVKEAEVEAAFVRYLLERGWDVDTDKVGPRRRGSDGAAPSTSSLRSRARPRPRDSMSTRRTGSCCDEWATDPRALSFAIVVPESARKAALRVPEEVRWRFGIDVWVVDELGSVALAQD